MHCTGASWTRAQARKRPQRTLSRLHEHSAVDQGKAIRVGEVIVPARRCGNDDETPLQLDRVEAREQVAKWGRPAVALLTPGSIRDGGWNQGAYEGLIRIRDELDAEVAHQETLGRKPGSRNLTTNRSLALRTATGQRRGSGVAAARARARAAVLNPGQPRKAIMPHLDEFDPAVEAEFRRSLGELQAKEQYPRRRELTSESCRASSPLCPLVTEWLMSGTTTSNRSTKSLVASGSCSDTPHRPRAGARQLRFQLDDLDPQEGSWLPRMQESDRRSAPGTTSGGVVTVAATEVRIFMRMR